jgi:O-antigen/teichoic acid export membrane protein
MSFKKGFFKSLLISGGYSYATQAISFFSSIITARVLAPESFGFVGLITVFTGFISIFSDSGISLAVIKSDHRYTFHKAVDSLALIIGIALCLLTCLLAYPISFFYKNEELLFPIIVMAAIFIPRSMAIVRGAILSKALKFHIIGRVSLISISIQILLTIFLAYQNFGFWSLIIPQIVSSLIMLIMYENETQLGFKVYRIQHIKVAYDYIKKTIGNLMGFNLINYWARNSDNLIVGKVYGVTDLGIYNRGYTLLTIPLALITGLIGNVLYPSLKKLEGEGGDVKNEYLFILKLITIISYPISFFLIVFPKELVLLLWGKNWFPVSELLPYFGLLIFSQSLLSTAGNILVLFNKEKNLMISGWVGAIVMILGIGFGAIYSVKAICQSYSLCFLLIVLPFNLYYVFIKTLSFPVKKMVLFWLPIILLSLGLWVTIFFNLRQLKIFSLIFLAFFIILQNKNELLKVIAKFFISKNLQLSSYQRK